MTTHPNRLFMCLPATESGVTSVASGMPVTRCFGAPGGYRSNRQLDKTVAWYVNGTLHFAHAECR